MRRRPVAWFFALALSLEVVVVAIFLLSGAAGEFDAARKAAGLEDRTDFVAAYRLASEAPQALGRALLGGDAPIVLLEPSGPGASRGRAWRRISPGSRSGIRARSPL